MYEQWADPACPICKGVGSRLGPDPERIARISCECVNSKRDRLFLQPLIPMLGEPKWDPNAKPTIHPGRHGLICGDLHLAAPEIYRTVSLWRHAGPPWCNELAVVTGDVILDHCYGREYAEALLCGHHLIVPMAGVVGSPKRTEILNALCTLMTLRPSHWPQFVMLGLSALSPDELAEGFPPPVWENFRAQVILYDRGASKPRTKNTQHSSGASQGAGSIGSQAATTKDPLLGEY